MFKRTLLFALFAGALVSGQALAQNTFPTPALPGYGGGSGASTLKQGAGDPLVVPWIVQLQAGSKVQFDGSAGPLPSQVWVGAQLVSLGNPVPVANVVGGSLLGPTNPLPADTVVRGTAVDRGVIVPVAAASAVASTGGSGYAVNDTVSDAAGTFKVTAVSSGAITALAVVTPINLTAIPTAPLAQTGTSGSGTGATLTPTYASVSVQLAPANPNRRGLGYQPIGAAIRVSGLGTATQDFHSLQIPAGAFYETPGHHVGTGAVNVIGDAGVTVPVPVYAREF